MWFIGVEVEQETSAPPPKKNPGSAPVLRQQTGRKHFARNLREFGVARSEELEVNQ